MLGDTVDGLALMGLHRPSGAAAAKRAARAAVLRAAAWPRRALLPRRARHADARAQVHNESVNVSAVSFSYKSSKLSLLNC